MPENKLGESRRSHCIGNFGPGAIVEFRTGKGNGAAISAVIGGLEQWDTYAKPAGMANPQVTYERRLQSYLKVAGFRLPPVDPDADSANPPPGYTPQFLVASRFPTWLQCPDCSRLRPAAKWASAPGDPTRRCEKCSKPNRIVYVAPARFVVACLRGHLQEFPWDQWLKHKPDCRKSDLKLSQSSRAGLAGLMLECLTCKETRSMEGAFGKETMKTLGIECGGLRPWLGNVPPEDPKCEEIPRAVQRGASNLYFPVVASALSIPPFTESLQDLLNPFWADFEATPQAEWPMLIKYQRIEEKLGKTKEEILLAAQRSLESLKAKSIADLRFEEYEKLSSDTSIGDQSYFDLRRETVPPALTQYFDKVVRVVRLREVRAIRGFTRINPPSGELEVDSPEMARIALKKLSWFPAIEVRGEGIFLRFKKSELEKWEVDHPEVKSRAAEIHTAFSEIWKGRHETEPPRTITPRFLLVHSFAHALIRQLTISSGYSSASLRERLYADDNRGMAGVLIYTATPDSDGSLGGLERQGRQKRINELVPAAVRAMEWCSNDPLCIKDISTFSDSQNRAACHSCMMVPETSCEEFNALLDRAMLVGKPDNREMGFFCRILNPLSDI